MKQVNPRQYIAQIPQVCESVTLFCELHLCEIEISLHTLLVPKVLCMSDFSFVETKIDNFKFKIDHFKFMRD